MIARPTRTVAALALAGAAFVALTAAPGRAEAGCICPDLTSVRAGALKVGDATIESQTWTVEARGVELELALSGVSTRTTIEVLAMGIPGDEYGDMLDLAKLNRDPGDDPRAEVTAPKGFTLAARVSRADAGAFKHVTLRWQVSAAAGDRATFKLAWRYPAAGADSLAHEDKKLAKAFCIDRGTRRAMKKARIHGYLRVDLVLSPDMAREFTLRIQRDEFPISLCAKKVKKKGENTFEVTGRDNLKDRSGVLPIVFTESI